MPAEYADDPDMYYAIQASLGIDNQINDQVKDNDSDPLEPMDNADFYENNARKAGTGSTGPNSVENLDYANVSMTDNTLPQI